MKKLILGIPLVLLLCITLICQDKEAMAELDKFRAQAAHEEQNKDIAKLLFKAIDTGSFSLLEKLFADDLVIDIAGIPEPVQKDMLFGRMWLHYSAFPGMHMINDVIADGDKVAVKLTQNVIPKKEDVKGSPTTGAKATLTSMHLITVVDGKIKEWFAIGDFLGLNKQPGMELKPKEGEKQVISCLGAKLTFVAERPSSSSRLSGSPDAR